MRLCRVLGSVVASAHHPAYEGRKVLMVRAVGAAGAPQGAGFIAVDNAQAGVGDTVLVLTEGTGVRQILGAGAGPIRSLIVGVVDRVDVPGGAGGSL
ncbi:MAG: EutN/CcmL family microcompartment protein [Myxococcota bacterium]